VIYKITSENFRLILHTLTDRQNNVIIISRPSLPA